MKHRSFLFLCAALAAAAPAYAEGPCPKAPCPSGWVGLPSADRKAAFALAEEYKRFMTVSRTEALTVTETIKRARAQGFREWAPGQALAAGGRYYHVNRARSIVLFVVGRVPIEQGARVSASHIDSPRLELKARPLYEAEGFGLFQTSPHGGILNYQWGSTPLALVGRVFRKDGTAVDISLGLDPGEPVFMVAGLSPHLDIDLRERKNRDVLSAEELDPIVGSVPKSASEGVAAQVIDHLRQAYGIGSDDLVSAELMLVPAMAPRDVGFDRALMAMSGQDDRFSAFASIDALFAVRAPERTAIVYLADNEESGNNNNTGASSDYLVDLMAQMAAAQSGGRAPDMARGRAETRVLSTDVNDGVNPQWPGAWEGGNAPRLNQGVNIKVYGQGNSANGEMVAWLRRVLDDAGVRWQTASYKVGRAGGGTLGDELSRRNMDVVDIGAPVLSIHNSYELSSKLDLWWLRNANLGFFTAAD